MAAVVKAVIEHNNERRDTSEFQNELGPLLKALAKGGLPEDYFLKNTKDHKAKKHRHPHAAPASSSSSSATGGDAAVGVPRNSAWPIEEEEDAPPVISKGALGNFVLAVPGEEEIKSDVETTVLTRLYVDLDDVVHELKLRVPKKDIPVHAEVEEVFHEGHVENEVVINGVKVAWYLWDRLESNQAKAHVFYNSDLVQFFTAGLIFGNFVVNAAEAQVREGEGPVVFGVLEMFFTAIFTVELAINFFAHKYGHFINSWNIFDSVVVFVSLLSLLLNNLPGIAVLRLMRAFRVFRLFKRLASLRKIMTALSNSVPGCSNAFAIVILVTSIYAILGVQFFRHVGEGEMKGRYFGTFLRAMLTMFQVMTGDSWAEGVSRPIMEWYPDNAQRVLVQMYFVSYILIVGIVLINVVVAVLLEKMTMDDDIEEVPEEDQLKGNADNQFKSLVGALATRLNKQDEDMKALTEQLVNLKKIIAAQP